MASESPPSKLIWKMPMLNCHPGMPLTSGSIHGGRGGGPGSALPSALHLFMFPGSLLPRDGFSSPGKDPTLRPHSPKPVRRAEARRVGMEGEKVLERGETGSWALHPALPGTDTTPGPQNTATEILKHIHAFAVSTIPGLLKSCLSHPGAIREVVSTLPWVLLVVCVCVSI